MASMLRHRLSYKMAMLYVESQIKKQFFQIHIINKTNFDNLKRPVIVASNHVSWWDTFLVVYLNFRLFKDDLYGLMDAKNLERFSFLRWIGAIKIDRQSHVKMKNDLIKVTLPPFNQQKVLIFPQGCQRPAHLRPLQFKPGVNLLCRLLPHAEVIPLAITYVFLENEKPEIIVCFGEPLPAHCFSEKTHVSSIEDLVDQQLKKIDEFLVKRSDSIQLLPRSRKEHDNIPTVLLSWWAKFWEKK